MPPARPGHDPYAALRLPGYRLYALGWLFGVVGHQIQGVAVGWEVYQRTGEALSLGYVGAIQAIPLILLALPAGHLADTMDRRKLTLVSALLSAGFSLGLAGCSYYQGSIRLFYLLLFFGAIATTLGRPARQALLPQIVPPHLFANAATWNSSLFQVASVTGPALGGVVVAFHVPLAYLLDAACMLLFALMLFFLRLRHTPREAQPASLQSLLAGVRFVFRSRVMLGAISLDLFAVLLGGATYLLPIFAKDILHVGPAGFGWLRAAPALGALATAMILAHLPPMKHAGRAMLLAVAGFGVATLLFGLSRSFMLSFAMLFLTGVMDNISVVVRHTLVQLLTPDPMRGRVSAVNSVFIGASNELGGFESGVTAAVLGPVGSVVLGGFGTLAVVGASAILCPQLRNFGCLQDARPEEEQQDTR
ncbi:MAG: MFS transporter [Planctomycetes bacterium]|nr:MFS transporter [Planctomycetota bacterium]